MLIKYNFRYENFNSAHTQSYLLLQINQSLIMIPGITSKMPILQKFRHLADVLRMYPWLSLCSGLLSGSVKSNLTCQQISLFVTYFEIFRCMYSSMKSGKYRKQIITWGVALSADTSNYTVRTIPLLKIVINYK